MEYVNYNQSLPPLEPGTVLKGNKIEYEILELTSNKGGFGRIYRARKLNSLYSNVAIKEYHLLDFDFAEWSKMHSWTMMDMEEYDGDMRMKFEQEAANLRKLYRELEDKHIPNVLDTVW